VDTVGKNSEVKHSKEPQVILLPYKLGLSLQSQNPSPYTNGQSLLELVAIVRPVEPLFPFSYQVNLSSPSPTGSLSPTTSPESTVPTASEYAVVFMHQPNYRVHCSTKHKINNGNIAIRNRDHALRYSFLPASMCSTAELHRQSYQGGANPTT
jgi:hypothetical protein